LLIYCERVSRTRPRVRVSSTLITKIGQRSIGLIGARQRRHKTRNNRKADLAGVARRSRKGFRASSHRFQAAPARAPPRGRRQRRPHRSPRHWCAVPALRPRQRWQPSANLRKVGPCGGYRTVSANSRQRTLKSSHYASSPIFSMQFVHIHEERVFADLC
jgi:hypothetical protein